MKDQDIRVLMLLDAFDVGGTETHVLSLTKELLKQGVSVYVSGNSGRLESKFRMLPCKIYRYHNKKDLEKWIRTNKINIIHAHHESSGRYAIEISQKLNIPLVYTIHGTYYNCSELRKSFNECSSKPTIISVSLPLQKWLEKKGIQSLLVPNGIDTNEFCTKKTGLKKKLNIPKKSKVMLYASRLEGSKYKICKLLLKAFEKELLYKFPNIHLVIAGGGKKMGKIKEHIKRIKSKRIRYVGNRNNMPDLYSISNYVVGTGRVALEALSCECSVIAVGSKGVFGLITKNNIKKALKYYFCDHKSYLPLNRNNITKVVKKGLLYKNDQWRKVLRREVQENLEISRISNEVLKIYKEKLRENRGL